MAAACGRYYPPALEDPDPRPLPDASFDDSTSNGAGAEIDVTPDSGTTNGIVEPGDAYVQQAPHCAPPDRDAGIEAGSQRPPPLATSVVAAPPVSSLPALVNLGGRTLHDPTLVAVTFAGDPLANELEDFVASLGCSDYWRTIAMDYGIGDGHPAAPIRLTEAAPTMTGGGSIDGWLSGHIGSDPRFPGGSAQPIYLLFYPESTVLTDGPGTSCKDFGGFHHGIPSADGVVTYGAIARCHTSAGVWGIRDATRAAVAALTVSASHEAFESATDPNLDTYYTTDANHLGWTLAMDVEVGDMCDDGSDRLYQPPGFPWWVQRIWSNRAANQGVNPCLPADTADYFYAAPLPKDTVMQSVQGRNDMARTLLLSVGQQATIGVELVSNFASGSLEVQAIDGNAYRGRPPHLILSLDHNEGMPGDVLNLTIKKTSEDPQFGAESFALVTTRQGRQTVFWGMTSD